VTTGPILTFLALIFVIIRVVARQPNKTDLFGWDDAMIVVTWCSGAPLAIVDGFFWKHGLGKDIWMVSFDDITTTLKLFYIGEMFYLFATGLVKLSLLMFFLRVFPHERFR
jgi:hypothetical protein